MKTYMIIALLLGGIFTVVACMDMAKQARLEKGGVTTDGEIMSGESRRSRRSTNYKFDIRYVPEGKSPITKSFSVTSSFFNQHTAGDSISNEMCQIRYMPDNPEDAIVVGGTSDMSWMLWPAAGVALVGLVGSGICLTRKATPVA